MAKRGRTKKEPGVKAEPPARSVRTSKDPEEVRRLAPAWSFQWLDRTGPWGWESISRADLLRVVERLRSLESMTWSEIDAHRSCGFIPTSVLSKAARDHLVEARRDDVDQLYKVRLDKRARIWGIRQGEKLRILWWDPDHSVYPMDPAGNRN